MDEHQHKEHVHTHPTEPVSPEVVHNAVHPEPGATTQGDDINVAQVAMIGTFLAVSLLVLVLLLQAWFYHADDAERTAKTVKQDDPSMPYGAMVQEHSRVLATGDSLPDAKGQVHHGVPITTAMKMVVDNPKLLSQPLSAEASKSMNRGVKHFLCVTALLLAMTPGALPVRAENATMPATMPSTMPAAMTGPKHLEDAAIVVPPAGMQLPMGMTFTDEAGKKVELGTFFNHDKPVLLGLMYYRCPGLCSQFMNELTRSVPDMKLKAGEQFDVVLVSIDPREKPELAQGKKDAYMELLGKKAAPAGWHLLTSPDNHVRDLADQLGFGYKLNPVNDQYMHATAMYILMPDGKISRVMANAMVFDPAVLDDSLTNASGGKIGSTLFSFAQTCGFVTFNHNTGRYESVAKNMMRAGAVLTILALGLTIGTYLYRDSRKRKTAAA